VTAAWLSRSWSRPRCSSSWKRLPCPGGQRDDLVKLIRQRSLLRDCATHLKGGLREDPSVESAGDEGDNVIHLRGCPHEVDYRLLGNGVRRIPGGRQTMALRDDMWIATPLGGMTRLLAGTVTSMTSDGASVSRLISAAVLRLR
jgi:hypothetical protein